jgi:hypothetical protein
MNRRALRQELGSRTTRRKGTKLHTQTLNKVKGVNRQAQATKRPSPASRLKELIRRG